MNDQELSKKIHELIHSLRLINGYKASEAEKKLSGYVIERYKDTCEECKAVSERIKNQPAKESFLTKLGRAIE
jgi:hypothetical protein